MLSVCRSCPRQHPSHKSPAAVSNNCSHWLGADTYKYFNPTINISRQSFFLFFSFCLYTGTLFLFQGSVFCYRGREEGFRVFFFVVFLFSSVCHTEANFAIFINICNVYYIFLSAFNKLRSACQSATLGFTLPQNIWSLLPEKSGCARLNMLVRVTLSQLRVQENEKKKVQELANETGPGLDNRRWQNYSNYDSSVSLFLNSSSSRTQWY